MDKDYQQYQWLQFATELPTFLEFLALLGASGGIIFVGHLIKSIWDRRNETVPIPVAIVMNVAMLFAYAVVVRMFYTRTPEDQKISILVWCFIFLVPTAFYYGRIIAVSFANRVIDQISPFNLRIEEPSEFAEARKMAIRGDVDGAVRRYRAYLENTDAALFEAARLLKSEDRFAEAAALFLEISERFYGKKLVWSEATYHLAKLRESHLHQTRESMGLLQKIVERAPDTRFGQLAQTELIRMESIYTIDPAESVNYAEVEGSEDPFFEDGQGNSEPSGYRQAAAPENGRHAYTGDANDAPAPPVDPFFAAAMKRAQEEDSAEGEATPPARKTSPKKAAAKRKSSPSE